jgi:uncharacterized heparinase superfamily protein
VQKKVKEQGAEPVNFNFLNREVRFSSLNNIDWNYAANGKLWTYNLNYFEFLSTMSLAQGLPLIKAWITKEASHKDGWEPYPLSLRLVSWIAFFIRNGQEPGKAITASLHRQYEALWTKLEYHLGANHLLENALALTLSSYYLGDGKGHQRATRLLVTELKDQYLPDGAHYELSPMYHIILLDRMLTVYQCLKTSPAPAPRRPADPPKITTTLGQSLSRQLGWIIAFATKDGRYAQFNDGTEGIAPTVPAVLKRAAQLKLEPSPVHLNACGYRRWSTGLYDLWIDAAAIGPNDIPGHAHADNLNFELHLNGQPIIVDAAISTYEKNERRAWERSTRAHNTVTVAERNSSDVWGGFRVGRRAVTTLEQETKNTLTASHNGYGNTHRRTFGLAATGLTITDELTPAETGTARFHFHESLNPNLTAEGCSVAGLNISWSTGEAKIVPYERAIGWNELRPARCLEVAFSSRVNFRITPNS